MNNIEEVLATIQTMTPFQSILALALLLLAGPSTNLASAEEDIPVENGVLVLTAETFPGVIEANEFVLVMFSGDKCGHCHRLMPIIEEVAAELATSQPEVRVAKVNVWAEQSLMKEYGIRGVPDVRLFRGGKPVAKYESKRTKEAILEWVKEKMAEGGEA
ncbi:hypothetical protein quinque_015199 [Culex quinquefasciatus]